jgi:hypothetical protein
MKRRGGMMMSAEGEAVPRRGKGGDNISWVDVNLTRLKNEENSCGRSSWYIWMVKI